MALARAPPAEVPTLIILSNSSLSLALIFSFSFKIRLLNSTSLLTSISSALFSSLCFYYPKKSFLVVRKV